ncbi:hypothetical protein [Natrarchaeobaculum aegyptiacum]|uniref:DUF8107 domain-containing protein n=1 Tax=Natrarchaeobaculum aegyptiacum TaxID=745377 RepID=A0A2Z2HTZ7_9EURY|nr:hypothetical protein [Natrarchaeobaculum aegyptiacum]ARS90716.1 hypothetical protein B1756_13905 [Natrarchaeobaculum aegyptiacum]
MTDPDGDRKEGFREGMESSEGDPRVVVLINAVLSVLFAWLLVWGGELVGFVEFSVTNVALVAVGLFVFTFVASKP